MPNFYDNPDYNIPDESDLDPDNKTDPDDIPDGHHFICLCRHVDKGGFPIPVKAENEEMAKRYTLRYLSHPFQSMQVIKDRIFKITPISKNEYEERVKTFVSIQHDFGLIGLV